MFVKMRDRDTTSSKTVCVMDASGTLGSSIVQRLQCSCCCSKPWSAFLTFSLLAFVLVLLLATEIFGSSGESMFKGCDEKKLKIFHSDPFDYQSIIDALRGCSGLFYVFEPPLDHPTYDESMAEVEVRAAHNVIEACAPTKTIDKVVFTSSVTAVIWRDDRNSIASDLDERFWSDFNFCRRFKLWHGLSKTLAERSARALAMDRGVNLVSINGGLLITSDLKIENPYLKGAAEMYEDSLLVTVDLNFLVDAHSCVFQDTSSYGRYLCFNHVITRNKDAIELAQNLTRSALAALSIDEEGMRIIEQRISNKKLNKLMVDLEAGSQLN